MNHLKNLVVTVEVIAMIAATVETAEIVEIVLREEITKTGNQGHQDSLPRCQQDLHSSLTSETFLLRSSRKS
jgi:hypothetical protein